MNQNSNQRCGCLCRPQIPAPPCMNTDCRCDTCDDRFLTPPAQIPPMPPARPLMPQAQPPTPPIRPAAQTPQQSTAAASASMIKSETKESSFTVLGGFGCGSSNPHIPNASINQMPFGMGYVPWQRWGQTYPVEQGFARGTIFPDLDLPFVMGRCR